MPETLPPVVFRVMVMIVRRANMARSVSHACVPALSVMAVWWVREAKAVVAVPVMVSLPFASVWWMSTVGVSARTRSSSVPVG